MDYLKFLVSNQKEKSIRFKRVKAEGTVKVYGLPKGQGLDLQVDTISRDLEAGSQTKWLVHYNMIVSAHATLQKSDLHAIFFLNNEKSYYICDVNLYVISTLAGAIVILAPKYTKVSLYILMLKQQNHIHNNLICQSLSYLFFWLLNIYFVNLFVPNMS